MSVTAAAGTGGDFAKQLRTEACGGGRLVIDASLRMLNDADSGYAGNVWAMDAIHRHVKVWQAAGGTFCAIVRDEGKFVTLAGPSPDNTGTIVAGIKGELEGGYRSTIFSGSLKTDVRTHGDLGTFDFACDASFNCPGYFSWRAHFFASTSGFDLAWWGWRYHAGEHGKWVDAVDVPQANAGDIR